MIINGEKFQLKPLSTNVWHKTCLDVLKKGDINLEDKQKSVVPGVKKWGLTWND